MSHLPFLSGLGQRSNCGRHTQLPFDLFLSERLFAQQLSLEMVGICFLVMQGKESERTQPFWLKVHTALVHTALVQSCNSVICTWLDATGKMCQLQTDRHRPMQAETMRGMLQSQSHGCVC